MKKLTITILVLTMLSCKKNAQCWYCEFTKSVNGYSKAPETICNKTEEEINKLEVLDPMGAEFGWYCKPK